MTNSQSPDRAALADELEKAAAIRLVGRNPKNGEALGQLPVGSIPVIVAALRSPSPYSGAAERKCATCHAILADGPQPAATYAPTTLPRDAERESDEVLAQEIHRVAGCQVGSERCKNIIRWYRGKLAQRGPRDAERETIDDLEKLVARFAERLLAKLKLARANGRSGWERDDWEADCQRGLLRHLEKGDPRDVAAYCAFMDHHGWITKAPSIPPREGVEREATGPTWQECVDIATLYDDCGGLFIAEKIRDLALSPSPR